MDNILHLKPFWRTLGRNPWFFQFVFLRFGNYFFFFWKRQFFWSTTLRKPIVGTPLLLHSDCDVTRKALVFQAPFATWFRWRDFVLGLADDLLNNEDQVSGREMKLDAKTRWWQLKYFWNFHPYLLGKMNPFWRAYFSNGLVKNHH